MGVGLGLGPGLGLRPGPGFGFGFGFDVAVVAYARCELEPEAEVHHRAACVPVPWERGVRRVRGVRLEARKAGYRLSDHKGARGWPEAA